MKKGGVIKHGGRFVFSKNDGQEPTVVSFRLLRNFSSCLNLWSVEDRLSASIPVVPKFLELLLGTEILHQQNTSKTQFYLTPLFRSM